MSTKEVTDAQRLTVLKHLASGKSLDLTATMTSLPREVVLDIGSNHGYPTRSKMEWAVEVLEKKLDEGEAIPERTAKDDRERVSSAVPVPAPPKTSSPVPTAPATKPDELRVLLNTAKGHPVKRIQNKANRIFDLLGELREAIEEDQRVNAEKRAQAAEKERKKAEVKRLEEELRKAREELRGSPAPKSKAGNDRNKAIREWAREQGEDVGDRGRIPPRVVEAYDEAHPQDQAS